MASIKPYKTAKGQRYRVQYTDPDGARRQKRGFLTKKQAETWATDAEATINKGTWINPEHGKTTIAELSTTWMASLNHLGVGTAENQKSVWRTHVEPKWAKVEISTIKPSHVQEWIYGIKRSASIIRQAHSCLAQILDIATKDRLILENPARGLKLPRKAKSEQVFLSMGQLRRLAELAGDKGVMVWILGTVGLRWGEFAALRPRDVDLKRGRFQIDRAVQKTTEHGLIFAEPKTHERRSVAVPQFVCNLLEPILEEITDPNALIFPAPRSKTGGPMRPPGHGSWFERIVKEALAEGTLVERITPHGLRHVAAGILVGAGAHVKAVQRQLGHKNASMTLDTYASLFDGDLDQIAEAIDTMHEAEAETPEQRAVPAGNDDVAQVPDPMALAVVG